MGTITFYVTTVESLNNAGAIGLFEIPICSFCKSIKIKDFITEFPNRLEKEGVISPTNFSQRAEPIVTVRCSSGRIRICANYSTSLNQNANPHFYPLPLPDDIFMFLNNHYSK